MTIMPPKNLPVPLHIFEEVAKKSNKIIFAFDTESRKFIFLNPGFQSLWNLTLEKVMANPAILLESLHPDDRDFLIQTYQEALEGAVKEDVEFRIKIEGEQVRWISLHPYLAGQESGRRVIAGFAQDITKSRNSEETLRKYAAKKDSVLEILSHDLAGPLFNINGISSLLAGELKEHTDPQIIKMIGIIEDTSQRSIQLIREFVKQEFLESENADLVKERVDVVKKMVEIIHQYKASEKEIGKTFSLKTSGSPIYAHIDDYKFSQVINNLISNSIKFTSDGGEISLGVEEKNETILFTVADNGIGIPDKYHDTLFDKFTRARRKGIKGEPSVGLGMSIIKTITEWHGGSIWFESKEGEGTVFYIELPKE